jgi:hypothetical protein
MVLSQNKKEEGRFCCAFGCNNKPVAKLAGLCYKHYQRKRRQADPVGVRFTQFRINALNRKKDFTITLEEFRAWCKITGYCTVKGRRGKNATIDRRCNIHGYHIWNITLLTNRQNASKGAGFRGDEFECPF